MQIKAGEIMKLMNQWAPPGLAESWDNPGLQTGRRDKDVRRILVALDVTEKNIDNINFCDMIKLEVTIHSDRVMFRNGLNCSKWKATNVMNEMKKAEILYKVKGYGPGKYKFIEEIHPF